MSCFAFDTGIKFGVRGDSPDRGAGVGTPAALRPEQAGLYTTLLISFAAGGKYNGGMTNIPYLWLLPKIWGSGR